MSNREIAYLYYSQHCPHSKKLIQDMWGYNKTLYHLIKKIDISKIPRSQIRTKLPQGVNSVPTLIPLDIGRPLAGNKNIRHWLNITANMIQENSSKNAQNTHQIKMGNGIDRPMIQPGRQPTNDFVNQGGGNRETININRNGNAMKWIQQGPGKSINTSMPDVGTNNCTSYVEIGQEVNSSGVSGNQDPTNVFTGVATSGSSKGFANLSDPTIYQFSKEAELNKTPRRNGDNYKLTEDMISRKQRERDAVAPPPMMRML